MTRVICDSSVIVKWYSEEDEAYLAQSAKLFTDWQAGQLELIEPDLIIAELANVLLIGKKWQPILVKKALEKFYQAEPRLVSMDKLWQKSVNLASKFGLAVYDAVYLALAEVENGTLVTADTKHHGQINSPRIVMLANYPRS